MNAKNKRLSNVVLLFGTGLGLLFPAALKAQDHSLPATEHYADTWSNEHIRLSRLPSSDTLCLSLLDSLTPQFCMPVSQVKVISPYGKRGSRQHTGIDLKQTPKDTIFAVFDGKVRMAKSYAGYGNTVVLRHANGLETVYAHLSKIWVRVDSLVTAGQALGLAGRSGRATTEHLHFECRFRYEPFNPTHIIDFEEGCLRDAEMHVFRGKVRQGQPLAAAITPEEARPSTSPEVASLPADTLKVASPLAKPEPQDMPSQTAAKKNIQYHKIKAGDTLYSLAKRYGTTVDQLKAWNGIHNPSALSVGRRIKVAQAP